MTKLTKNILEKIKKEQIKPKPKWYFILMHILLWTSVVISIFLGAMATAIILRHSLSADWTLMNRLAGGNVKAFIMILPYFWFAFIALILFLASKLFCHTKKGYRIKPWIVTTGSIMISIVFGIVFYISHLDEPFEGRLRQHLPYYEQRQENIKQRLVNPEKGVLAGKIIQITPQTKLIIIDFKKMEWEVDIRHANHGPLKEQMHVGMIGQPVGNFVFKAHIIKPLKR